MGYGCYSVADSSARSVSYASRSISQNFKSRRLDNEMSLKGKIRESRDSDEHPESFPVIIALDVTGSMGSIPQRLVTGDFPHIMEKVMSKGVKDLQVCFLGVGDHYCDECPIQGGQFETSDDLMEKWLMKIYLEGGGGPNLGESYSYAWVFGARSTSTDAWEKRHQKGVLITIGDETCNASIDKNSIKEHLLESAQADITTKDILKEAQEKWDVWHINVKDWSGSRREVREYWQDLLGDHTIDTQDANGDDITDIITGIITTAYEKRSKASYTPVVNETSDSEIDAAML